MKTKTLIVLALLAVGGVAVVAFGCCSGVGYLFYSGYQNAVATVSPRVDEMFQAIQEDRFGATYLTHTTPELRQTATLEQYEEIGHLIQTHLGPLRSKSIRQFNTRQVNAETYTDVLYNGEFAKGTGTIKVKLKKMGGEWQFVSFQVESPEFTKHLSAIACPKCGKPHARHAKFCPHCGTELAAPAPPEAPSVNSSDPPHS